MLTAPHVLILPGWQNSGPLHWQSLWQAAHGTPTTFVRVEQHGWQRPLRGDWCARLEEVIVNHLALTAAADAAATASASVAASAVHPQTLSKSELLEQDLLGLQPDIPLKNNASVVLVAHSLGCHLVAAWAAASRHTSAVRGALLVAPPDVTQADLPPDLYNWRRPVLDQLPFPAICAISNNDPFASHAAGCAIATAWGARCVEVGARGHINGDSGLGHWPAGLALVSELANLPNNAKSGVHRHPT
jgi:uncharacterized protein